MPDEITLNTNIFASSISNPTANFPNFNYASFVSDINKSATLVATLNKLGPNKIVLGEVSNAGGATYSNGIITIDPQSLSSPTLMGLLAHEAGHIGQGNTNTVATASSKY